MNVFPKIIHKAARVFTLTYYCEACPSEWTDETLCVTHSYCPCCDARTEPGTIEEAEVIRPEFDLGEFDLEDE